MQFLEVGYVQASKVKISSVLVFKSSHLGINKFIFTGNNELKKLYFKYTEENLEYFLRSSKINLRN